MSLEITTDFPGGNGIITYRPNDALLLDRDLRNSVGDRWYWRVRMRSSRTTAAEVELARPGLLGCFGPWIRANGREGWLASTPIPDGSFSLAIEPGNGVDVCATAPYDLDQLCGFIRRTEDPSSGADLRWTKLTKSEDGWSVPLVMTEGSAPPRRTILLTARHHACEAMASYVLEGAIARFTQMRQEAQPEATTTQLLAVPMIDIDGVRRGDPGKARLPWDHNRDYRSRSRYRAVSALRKLIVSEDLPLFAFDVHTPGLRGELEEKPYVVASGDAEDVEQAHELLRTAAIPGAELLIFDEEWNKPTSPGQRSCTAWLRSLRRTELALTIEYPNAVDHGRPVSPASARRFGDALIRALLRVITDLNAS